MKLFTFLIFGLFSVSTYAQICEVDMVDNRGRILQTFQAYGDEQNCMEGMKECRKEIRIRNLLNQADCVRKVRQPSPRSAPAPQPLPLPQAGTRHHPQPYQRLPLEVERMDEITQAINYVLEDCYVVPSVAGIYNQLYVRGQFTGNFEVGRMDMALSRALRDHQFQGKCLMKSVQVLQIQFAPDLIDQAVDYTLSKNCHVLPLLGSFQQLYVNNQFSGNFERHNQFSVMKLRSILAGHLVSGQCRPYSLQEQRILSNPRLIQDFANHQYRGCHIRQNFAGHHQLYVGNSLRGNYVVQREDGKLKRDLVNLISNGTCQFDPL